ncbi:protein of avirulence locus involved in temperature-dependent protein secretion [Burkholderiales bacterium JOSHI_001]|nr:protein of avirulence locus involved in temperature-dependent protein secretion [Burkholderiales bacterium JOSHI_001]
MSAHLNLQFSSANPLGQLADLQARIRKEPQRADLRIFLFQVYCLQGEWAKASAQLQVVEELDKEALSMVQTYREALRCELLRRDVFAGERTPLVLGDPQDWLAWLLEANRLLAQGHVQQAAELRAKALDAAPAVSGTFDGEPFEWLADADSRLGPVLEAVLNGKYYWIPTQRLVRIEADAPADLRDFVWTPVTLTFTSGGSNVALLPTRYPGTEASGDDRLKMARATDWKDLGHDTWVGLGQRMLATDQGDHALLDLRVVEFNNAITDVATVASSAQG